MSNRVALGEIATLQAGTTFPPEMQGRATGDYPFAKVGDISRQGRSGESTLESAVHFVDESDLITLRARPVPAGSVVFAKIGEAIRQNHRVIAGRPMLIDNNAMAAIPGPHVHARYLYRYLQTVDFYRLASSTTVPALRKSELEKLRMPLPPMGEQRRIADILDRADALRAKRREALALLDDLTQSIFLDMFGHPRLGSRFPCDSVLDLCTAYSGATPSKASPQFWNGPIPWFSPKDLKSIELHDSEDHVAESVPATTTMRLLPPGTVLMVVRGMILAHTVPVSISMIPATINQDLKALLPRTPIDPSFLLWAIRAQHDVILSSVSTAAHGTKKIDTRALAEIRVPRPGGLLETRFAERAAAVRTQVVRSRTAHDVEDALFASLQQRAFAGEL